MKLVALAEAVNNALREAKKDGVNPDVLLFETDDQLYFAVSGVSTSTNGKNLTALVLDIGYEVAP